MRRQLILVSIAAVVAAASADSSIVALALPQLYDRFHTTVVGCQLGPDRLQRGRRRRKQSECS